MGIELLTDGAIAVSFLASDGFQSVRGDADYFRYELPGRKVLSIMNAGVGFLLSSILAGTVEPNDYTFHFCMLSSYAAANVGNALHDILLENVARDNELYRRE
ncbi:MAG: hypothetical protein ABIH92_03400 [Nanoarchaeota archaeon]